MKSSALKLCIKLLVSGGLLTFLLFRAELDTIWEAFKSAEWVLVAMAFMLFYVHFLLGGLRWRLLARLHGADPTVWYLMKSFMVANFFNNFLPSTIGGDIVRVYDTWRAGTSKTGAAATILVDRVVGVLALAIVAAVGTLVLRFHGLISIELQILVVLVILGLAVIVALLFHPPKWWPAIVARASGHSSRWIAKPATIFAEVSVEFQSDRSTLAKALALSFLVHINTIVAYYLVGSAVGIHLDFSIYVAIIPPALVVMMLPVSINGIGLREGTFSVLLGLFGVSLATSLALSWTYYGLILLHGILGGIVYLARKDRLPRKEAEAA